MTFEASARRLAGFAGAILGWTPDAFWRATPDELAAVLEVMAPAEQAPAGAIEIARLKEMFPDG